MQLDFMLTLQKVLVLFLLMVIGFIAGRTNIVSKTGQSDITNLVLYVTMPATIFSAMQLEYNTERIQRSTTIFLIMICCYVLMFVIGYLVTKKLPLNMGDKDIMRVALLLSNTSFMGYPVVESLLGEEALFYAVIGAGFIFEIVSWSLGVYMIGRNSPKKAEIQFNWKNIIFSPGVLSIIVGLIFFFWQIPVVEPISSVISTLSAATSPLAMIVVGLILSRNDIKEAFKNKYVYLVALVKLLVVPLIILSVLKLLNFDGMELIIPTIMLSMPTASYVAMFANKYENNPKFASQLVFMTTLLSVITIPIITLFF